MQNPGNANDNRDKYRRHDVIREDRPDGTIILTSSYSLESTAANTGVWLHQWAAAAPSRIFIAERSGEGWREHSYSETLQMVRAAAASLVARGIGPGHTVVALSGNSVDHAVLALAAQYIGAAIVPLAEQYSLIPNAHDRLRSIAEKVRPSIAYVSSATRFADALAVDKLRGIEVVASDVAGARQPVTPFADLLKASAGPALDTAHALTGPDTLAKILFTSGTTAQPKGVPTTHRMMCVNQAQIAACWPFLADRPPKILDWLPWNHVFGGSHNFNMMLANGGSYYIDSGKPTKNLFVFTLLNLRDHAGTLSFNVPLGYAMLLAALRNSGELRRKFFGELDLIFYAGASLPQEIWSALETYARQERGSLPLMASSWGMTETAPATLVVHEPVTQSGIVGVPVPGGRVKLVPGAEMRCELRVAGPNVMDGYFEDTERSAASFDEEGFFVTGDAVRFLDTANPSAGLVFDGRIAEDFKLLSGTWVHATNLHRDAMRAFTPLACDIVICGHDRREVGILVFPDRPALAALGIFAEDDGAVLTGAVLEAAVAERLSRLIENATGSSTLIARVLVLSEPPSVEAQEITAKGNLNNRLVLARRAAFVSRLYDDADPAVIRIAEDTI